MSPDAATAASGASTYAAALHAETPGGSDAQHRAVSRSALLRAVRGHPRLSTELSEDTTALGELCAAFVRYFRADAAYCRAFAAGDGPVPAHVGEEKRHARAELESCLAQCGAGHWSSPSCRRARDLVKRLYALLQKQGGWESDSEDSPDQPEADSGRGPAGSEDASFFTAAGPPSSVASARLGSSVRPDQTTEVPAGLHLELLPEADLARALRGKLEQTPGPNAEGPPAAVPHSAQS